MMRENVLVTACLRARLVLTSLLQRNIRFEITVSGCISDIAVCVFVTCVGSVSVIYL